MSIYLEQSAYMVEAIDSHATHYDHEGHAWRVNLDLDKWQVYRLGCGWTIDEPNGELVEINRGAWYAARCARYEAIIRNNHPALAKLLGLE